MINFPNFSFFNYRKVNKFYFVYTQTTVNTSSVCRQKLDKSLHNWTAGKNRQLGVHGRRVLFRRGAESDWKPTQNATVAQLAVEIGNIHS